MPTGAFATLQGPIADLLGRSSRSLKERGSSSSESVGHQGILKLTRSWKLRDEAAVSFLGGISNGAFYHLQGGQNKEARPRPAHASFSSPGDIQSLEYPVQRTVSRRVDLLAEHQSDIRRRNAADVYDEGWRSRDAAGASASRRTQGRSLKLPGTTALRRDDTHRLIPTRYIGEGESVLARLTVSG